VIYTASTGGYDDIVQPLYVCNQFDYILFSDCAKSDKWGVWNVVAPKIEGLSPILLARYIKTHPHELLPQYDAWIWVDSNITFSDSFICDRFKDWFNSPAIIAACPHPATDDVYEHIYEMCYRGVEHDVACLRAMRYLYDNKYPEHYGLSETGILFRKNVPQITTFDEKWWWHIQHISRRDQFSFNYVLYSIHLAWETILPADEPIARSSHVIYGSHSSIAGKRKEVNANFGEWCRQYVRHQHPAIYMPFVQQHKKMSRKENYALDLKLWGWYMFPLHLLYVPYTYRSVMRKIAKLRSR